MTPPDRADQPTPELRANTGAQRIEIAAGDIPGCSRCGGEGLLSARVPHGFDRKDGHRVNGSTVVVLCPRCDADGRAAGALITFFHVHGGIAHDTIEQSAALIHAWAATIHIPPVDETAVEAEFEAWKRNDL